MKRIIVLGVCVAAATSAVAQGQIVQIHPGGFAPPEHIDPKPLPAPESAPLGAYPLPASGDAPAAAPAPASRSGEIDTQLPSASTQCKLHDDAVQDTDGSKRIVLGCDN